MGLDVLPLLSRHGDVVVVLSVFAAELGIPMPLPNELVLAWAGYLVRRGDLDAWGVLTGAVAADQAGSLLSYGLCRAGGRRLLHRYGHGSSCPRPAWRRPRRSSPASARWPSSSGASFRSPGSTARAGRAPSTPRSNRAAGRRPGVGRVGR